MASACPHCGYDFPMAGAEPRLRRPGFAYTKIADLALLGGTAAAAIACVLIALQAIAALVQGNLQFGLVVCPLGFLLLAGTLVVFLRMRNP